MTEREIVAHHEAGHAVIAFMLGVPVECVTIEPFEGRSGITWHHKTSPENEILITMAGPFAESKFTGRLFWAGDDEARITLLQPNLPEPREHYEVKAAALVRENWDDIEAIAFELLFGVGRLYREQIDVAIRCSRLLKSS
jgi:hypothetical protein